MDPMMMKNPYMPGFDPNFMMGGMMPGMGMPGNMPMPNQGMPGDGMMDIFMGMQMGNQPMGNPNDNKAMNPSPKMDLEKDPGDGIKDGNNEEK